MSITSIVRIEHHEALFNDNSATTGIPHITILSDDGDAVTLSLTEARVIRDALQRWALDDLYAPYQKRPGQ